MTYEKCLNIERELEHARKEYNAENEPCCNSKCTFYIEGYSGNCSYYHYYADECREYKTKD